MGCVAQFQLKLKISPLEKEKSVGPFNVDILAEDNRGRTVIIELVDDKFREVGNFTAGIHVASSEAPAVKNRKRIMHSPRPMFKRSGG
jgi:hypothetical protein